MKASRSFSMCVMQLAAQTLLGISLILLMSWRSQVHNAFLPLMQAEIEAMRCDVNLPSPGSSREPSETIAAVYPASSALHQTLRAHHSTSMGPSKYSSPSFRERPVSAATVQSPSSPRISASPRGYSGQVKVGTGTCVLS